MEKKITLNDWLKKWFSLYSKPNVKHSTAVSYECYIRKHIIPEIGNVYMDNIDLDTLQNFFNTKSQELSPKSVSNIRMMMHTRCFSIKDNDAVKKVSGLKTMAAGGIAVSVSAFLHTFV